MTRQDAVFQIRQNWKQLYPQDKSGKGIICPLCGNGSGSSGDGIRENPKSKNPGSLTCFKCGFSGDVIDLIGQERSLSFLEATNAAAAELNIAIDEIRTTNRQGAAQRDFAAETIGKPTERKNPLKDTQEPQSADYTEYYKECRARLDAPEAVSYLQDRGISYDTAARAGIGYDPAADPANAPGAAAAAYKPHPAARIIIPTSRAHYVGRAIAAGTPDKYKKLNARNSRPGIFNEAALYAEGTAPVFVCEGAFDALSILEAGRAAIAINSTSNVELLLSMLEAKPTRSTLIICLDNDNAGTEAARKLKQGLQRLNVSCTSADICNGAKDPNEALIANKEKFSKAIAGAVEQATRPDNVNRYISELMSGEIERFKEAKDRKTGFTNLDMETGGLYAGLYCIAAISSLGKTTFAHQMADQIAAAGEEVLFFSMEQSRLELVSKSLARITARNNIATAVDSLSIRRGFLPESVLKAADDYTQAVQDRISIIEGNFNCNISFIGDYIRQYIQRTGKRPAVFIDYLQILQPGEEHQKQQKREAIDNAVTELKRISREHELSVFIISSVNRANYLTPIDFESLKESGGIEYTCDVIWGLQLQCLNEPLFDTKDKIKEKRQRVKEAKAADPRKIELVCLKNRYGRATFSCAFDYYPRYDLFVSKEMQEPEASSPARSAKRI